MQAVHMNPAEAVQAHLDLEASESIGMHFGTFQMTTEGIDELLRALEDACRAKSIPPSRFRTLHFGESVRLGEWGSDVIDATRPSDRPSIHLRARRRQDRFPGDQIMSDGLERML